MTILSPKITALAISGILLACNFHAQAQDPSAGLADSEGMEPLSAEEALVIDGKSYAARYNVALEEAMRRITLMAGSGDEISALGREFGDDVSGIYFDNGADFGLKVRLTGQEKPPTRRIDRKESRQRGQQGVRRPERQEARESRRVFRNKLGISEAEIGRAETVLDSTLSMRVDFIPGARTGRRAARQTVQSRLDQVSHLLPGLQGIGYDERKGAVVIQVVGISSSVTDADRRTVAGLFDVPVEYEFIARPLSHTAARGGTQLSYADGRPNCTAAFFGYDPANRPGLFTGAHCYAVPVQDIFYTDTDGRRYQLIFDPNLNLFTTKEDVLFLRFPAGLTGLPQFHANRNESPRVLTGRRTLGTTNVASGTAQGSWVCYYGMRSSPTHGQGCGEVRYKEFAASISTGHGKMTVSNGPSYYVQVQGPTSGMRCGPGDSGAPWFAYTVAFGIMSSCGENMIGNLSVANYTSMDAAYARNYRRAY